MSIFKSITLTGMNNFTSEYHYYNNTRYKNLQKGHNYSQLLSIADSFQNSSEYKVQKHPKQVINAKAVSVL